MGRHQGYSHCLWICIFPIKFCYRSGQRILIIFYFTIKETRIDYHNYVVYSQLASGVGEQLKIVVVIVTAATVVSFQLVLQKLIQWYTFCLNFILIMLMQHFGTRILHMKVTSGRNERECFRSALMAHYTAFSVKSKFWNWWTLKGVL